MKPGVDPERLLMLYANGAPCGGGAGAPPRYVMVRLQCSDTTELLSVEENGVCEYHATVASPAACSRAKLGKLQEKLREVEALE